MGGDELFSAVAAPTLGSPTSPDRKLLRHPILASQYKELGHPSWKDGSHSSSFVWSPPHSSSVQDSSLHRQGFTVTARFQSYHGNVLSLKSA